MSVKEELSAPCPDGEHVPMIVHRTGGLPAEVKNACAKCGRVIWNVGGRWVIDAKEEEQRNNAGNTETPS